ncbi:Solute symporter family transporter [Lasiodiplodia theobromae]|uniref:Solute symporter family transporter n=1 Tax=Lasiodiplodia theobromae TaxID=45133 RepID=UPI0015C3AB56|nr:Solute symporter family transporter [Lasiodiplodia theobromae]KAF4535270.1 Solute symporter family transporter [Lasiodiplodia theobromae]
MSSHSAATTLPEAAGYGVVIGVGFFFAFVMMGISYMQNRYTRFSTKQSEEFNTASRSVKPGLIASGIVSAWTWAATLLQSSTVAYTYGVAGPFWYAAGATVQILMFSILACKVKQNAPRCHTFLEIIYTRYGRVTHMIFVFFALVTNILVGSQLLLGGSAVVTNLTGMNVYAAIFLIPTGVCAYVVLGGLRATFLCDYSHTLILMIIILFFMFHAYATSDLIGSPSQMYDLLKQAAIERPVDGNKNGSYLTLKSNFALVFGVIQLCSGSGTVFLDQAYWQRAIASRPSTAVRAYILGGLAWFAIPFGFSTTLGLAAVALTSNPHFPTYPDVPSESQISAGLAAAFSASALLGKSGAAALLVVLFMAVTSCASAELIAVSSILTFDVYKTYISPKASPERLIAVSHAMICVFGATMAVFACVWNAAGIDLGWLFLVMGLLIGGAVFPAAFAVTWRGQTRNGAVAGALGGLAVGLAAWLGTAKGLYGGLSVEATGREYPTLAGNLGAVGMGLVLSVGVSLLWPDERPFDWEATRGINAAAAAIDGGVSAAETTNTVEGDSGTTTPMTTAAAKEEKEGNEKDVDTKQAATAADDAPAVDTDTGKVDDVHIIGEPPAPVDDDDPKSLRGAFRIACVASFVLTFIMDFLVPMPMFFAEYEFSKPFFTAWVVISFIWVFASTAISCVLPIVETAGFFGELWRSVVADFRGKAAS